MKWLFGSRWESPQKIVFGQSQRSPRSNHVAPVGAVSPSDHSGDDSANTGASNAISSLGHRGNATGETLAPADAPDVRLFRIPGLNTVEVDLDITFADRDEPSEGLS